MHRICFAPVLSATLSRDSCWIMVCLLLLRLLEDLHHAPALGGAEGAGLHDQDTVTDAAVVLLVVGLQLAGPAQHLAVERVLDAVLDGDDDGLVHLVADDQALTDLARRTLPCGCGAHSLVAHAAPSFFDSGADRMPSSRSRTTV